MNTTDDDIKKQTLEELMQMMDGMSSSRLPKRNGVTIEISAGGEGGEGSAGEACEACKGAGCEMCEGSSGGEAAGPEDDLEGVEPRFADILRKKRQEKKV